MRSSYHLCVECFSQLSFDSEVYTKSATLLILYTLLNQMRVVKNIGRKDDRITSRVRHIFLDFKVSRYIEGYSFLSIRGP